MPKDAQDQVKADYWGIFDVPENVAPGDGAVALVQRRIDGFAARWRDAYPRAVACLLDDRDALTQYLRMPRDSPKHCVQGGTPTGHALGTPTSSSAPSGRPAVG